MKKHTYPIFKKGKVIKNKKCMVAEKKDIEKALKLFNLSFELLELKLIREIDFLNIFMKLDKNKEVYRLKKCDFPIYLTIETLNSIGVKHSIKSFIATLEVADEKDDVSYMKL